MPNLDRTLSGTLANVLGICVTAVLQILSVPMLMGAWGAEGYGSWLMLTTIPTYFLLSDIGFIQASTSSMTMLVARNERRAALTAFRSLWVFVISISIVLTGISYAVLCLTTIAQLGANPHVILIMIVYSALLMCSLTVSAAFQSTENYALGTIINNLLLLSEGLSVLLTAYLGGGYSACAEVLVLIRTLGFALLLVVLHRRVPWLRIGFARSPTRQLKRLLVPALSATAIPVSLALNLQGMVLVVGTFVSPAAVATFGAVRIVGRVMIHIVGALNRATMPEAASTFALGDRRAHSRILAVNLLSIAVFLIPGSLLFAAFGPFVIRAWTFGKIDPSVLFVSTVAFGTMMHGLWFLGANLLLATNSHIALAPWFLTTSIVSIVAAVPAARYTGIEGVALVIAGAETLYVAFVVRCFLRYNFIEPRDLTAALSHIISRLIRN